LKSVGVAGVDDDLVPLGQQGDGGGSAESMGGTGDEGARHEGFLSSGG
jgi:hypothetical protein